MSANNIYFSSNHHFQTCVEPPFGHILVPKNPICKKCVHVSGLIKTHPASHASLTQAGWKIRAEGKGLPGKVSPPLLRRCPDQVPCWGVWARVRGVVLQAPTHLCPTCSCGLPPRAQHFWREFTAGLKAAMSGGAETHKKGKLQGLVPHQSSPYSANLRPEHGISLLSQGLAGPFSTCRALLSSRKDRLSLPGLFSWAAPIPVMDGCHLTMSSHCGVGWEGWCHLSLASFYKGTNPVCEGSTLTP